MNKDIIFTFKEYKEKYNELLRVYLEKHVDFDELDFLNNVEIPKYLNCSIQSRLIEDEDHFLSFHKDDYDHSDYIYSKNMTTFDIIYCKTGDKDSEGYKRDFIPELHEKLKDENGQISFEKSIQLLASFDKIQDFLDEKRDYVIDEYRNSLKKDAQLQIEIVQTEPINETEQKTPYKIALLQELGFFNLDAIKKLTKENQYKVISTLTGGTHRTIKGNVLVLDSNSNEDRIKYTSNNYTDEVKNYLDKLK